MRTKDFSFLYGSVMRTTLLLLVVSTISAATARAQAFSVLHNFSARGDGSVPLAGPTLDPSGNLYGTTTDGGSHAVGNIYKLTHQGSSWILSSLYTFTGGEDGASPGSGSLILGTDGTLFGTTYAGGSNGGGVLYKLRPPAHFCGSISCPWTETVLHAFGADNDGVGPDGRLFFDAAGNLYGTTKAGGAYGDGTVFELAHSGQSWTETILYSFAGGGDGAAPINTTMDAAGNIYGVAYVQGPGGDGTIFELTLAGSTWTKTTLYAFHGPDGANPTGVTLNSAGDLFGGTVFGGGLNGGVAFELSPSNNGFTYTDLHDFTPPLQENYGGPLNVFTIDAAGNIFGTTYGSGQYLAGSAFELAASGGGWTFTELHDFTGGSDGYAPYGALAMDASGKLYGTTIEGGTGSYGVVFQLTP